MLVLISALAIGPGTCNNGVAFADRGDWLIGGSANGKVAVWSAKSWTPAFSVGIGDEVTAVAISESGDFIAAGANGKAIWWKRSGRAYEKLFEKELKARVGAVAFSKDEANLSCSTAGVGNIVIFDTQTGKIANRLYELGNGIGSLCYSSDGKTLTSAGQTWMMWSPKKRTALASVPLTGGSSFVQEQGQKPALIWQVGLYTQATVISPDGALVAGVGHAIRADEGYARSLVIRRSEDGTQVKSIRSEREPFTSIAWSSDGKWIVAGGEDEHIWVWDWKGVAAPRRIPCNVGKIRSLSFQAKTNLLAVGGDREGVELRNIPDGNIVRNLEFP